MSSEKQPEYLAHHGVKGMKWGVKKQERSDGSRSKKKDRIRSKASSVKNRFRSKQESQSDQNGRKKLSEMSDAELSKRISRMEKEKRYLDLDNQLHPKKISVVSSVGKKFLSDVVGASFTNASRTILTKTLTDTGQRYVDKVVPKEKTLYQRLQAKNNLLGAKKKNIELTSWLDEYNETGVVPKKKK